MVEQLVGPIRMRPNRLEIGRRKRATSLCPPLLASSALGCYSNPSKVQPPVVPRRIGSLLIRNVTVRPTSSADGAAQLGCYSNPRNVGGVLRTKLESRPGPVKRVLVTKEGRQRRSLRFSLRRRKRMGSAAGPSSDVITPTRAPHYVFRKTGKLRARITAVTPKTKTEDSDSEGDQKSSDMNESESSSSDADGSCDEQDSSQVFESDKGEEAGATASGGTSRLSNNEFQGGAGTNSGLKYMTQEEISKIKAKLEGPRKFNLKEIKVHSNPEDFFLATASVKYKGDNVEAEAKKGPKKPRKGNRTGAMKGSNLPERSLSNFSVSKELANLKLNCTEAVPEKHVDEVENIRKEIVKDFPRWIYMLREGFSVMLYGYGSKLQIFEEFTIFLDEGFLYITINGLFPKINPRKFLTGFWDALELDDPIPKNSSVSGLADDMYRRLLKVDHPSLFLLVSSIEILASKHPQCFSAICSIVRLPFVHLISSCDHINTGLGVDQGQLVQLNFTWVDCTTFCPYDHELKWKLGVFGADGTEGSSKSTLDHVMKSLTANARKAFKILVSLQLGAMKLAGKTKSKDFAGVEFRELARRCREGFIAHSDMGLRTLLQEFVDHKLVRHSGKNKKADSLLVVDVDLEILQKIAEDV